MSNPALAGKQYETTLRTKLKSVFKNIYTEVKNSKEIPLTFRLFPSTIFHRNSSVSIFQGRDQY